MTAHQTFFDQHGYVSLPGFLDANRTATLITTLEQFIATELATLTDSEVYYDDKERPETLKQIQHLERHDPTLAELLFDSPFARLASELLGEPVLGRNMQYFDKPPGSSQPTPAHQDGFYFMLTPGRAVTMWLALDPADEANGCMTYLPGSHTSGIRPHVPSGTLGFSQTIPGYPTPTERAAEIPMTATPGQLIAHDAHLIHSAAANATADRRRRALGFIYYGASAREDVDAHAAYQRELAASLRREGKI